MTATLANIGLPMIFVHGPIFFMGFIPIVLIETAILKIALRETNFRACLGATALSNFVSTIVGLPLTWFVFVVIQMFAGGGGNMPNDTVLERLYAAFLQAPWQLPYIHDYGWMIPRAAIIMLLPFFIISYLVERVVVTRLLAKFEGNRIRRGVYWGNVASYSCLAGFWIIMLMTNSYS